MLLTDDGNIVKPIINPFNDLVFFVLMISYL